MGQESSTPLAPKVYTREEIVGNGLVQLTRLTDSKLVTRGFKNHLKSIGIYRPAYVDKHQAREHLHKKEVYDPSMSNKKFKYEYVKRTGSPKGLSDLKKTSITIAEYKFPGRPLTRHRMAGLLMKQNRLLEGKRHDERPVRVKRQETSFVRKNVLPVILEKTGKPVNSKRLKAVGKVFFEHNGTFVSYLGGKTHKFNPEKGHRKYWYFLRKRGCWTFSQHHPYGDENVAYREKVTKPPDVFNKPV